MAGSRGPSSRLSPARARGVLAGVTSGTVYLGQRPAGLRLSPGRRTPPPPGRRRRYPAPEPPPGSSPSPGSSTVARVLIRRRGFPLPALGCARPLVAGVPRHARRPRGSPPLRGRRRQGPLSSGPAVVRAAVRQGHRSAVVFRAGGAATANRTSRSRRPAVTRRSAGAWYASACRPARRLAGGNAPDASLLPPAPGKRRSRVPARALRRRQVTAGQGPPRRTPPGNTVTRAPAPRSRPRTAAAPPHRGPPP